jgi:xylulokinase
MRQCCANCQFAHFIRTAHGRDARATGNGLHRKCVRRVSGALLRYHPRMPILGLDIGSSSVKAGVLRGTRVVGKIGRASFATRYDGPRAEAEPEHLLRAVARAIKELGPAAKTVDAVALSVMAPAWLAMDRAGKPLTPIVTHQDRRSVDVARDLEKRIGKRRLLKLVGNRPFPGGISSTTWAWFNRHEPRLMKRAALVGHLNTLLHVRLTGARVIDPSNGSFTGLFRIDQSGWSDEVMAAVGAREDQLPQVIDAGGVGGLVTRDAARTFGLTHGTPVLAGLIDTGSAMLLAGARPGQLLDVCGSTNVLALCVATPRPHERLITRALGAGTKWLSVSTQAAAGSALSWMRDNLFCDGDKENFNRIVRELASRPMESSVRFENYLAGDRTSLEQRTATLSGLTLSTTRRQMLSSVIESLAAASSERVKLLRAVNKTVRRDVVVSGGAAEGLADILHRDWAGKWRFRVVEEASLRGLGTLVE